MHFKEYNWLCAHYCHVHCVPTYYVCDCDSFSHVSQVHKFGWAEQRPHFHCVIYPSSSPFILSICRAFYASFIVPRWFIWSSSYSALSPHSWQKLTTRLNLVLSPSFLSHDTLCCLHIFGFFFISLCLSRRNEPCFTMHHSFVSIATFSIKFLSPQMSLKKSFFCSDVMTFLFMLFTVHGSQR